MCFSLSFLADCLPRLATQHSQSRTLRSLTNQQQHLTLAHIIFYHPQKTIPRYFCFFVGIPFGGIQRSSDTMRSNLEMQEYQQNASDKRRISWSGFQTSSNAMSSIENSSKSIRWFLQIFESYKVALKNSNACLKKCRTKHCQNDPSDPTDPPAGHVLLKCGRYYGRGANRILPILPREPDALKVNESHCFVRVRGVLVSN